MSTDELCYLALANGTEREGKQLYWTFLFFCFETAKKLMKMKVAPSFSSSVVGTEGTAPAPALTARKFSFSQIISD